MSSLPCRLKQQRVERKKKLHQWNGYQRVVDRTGSALDLTGSSPDLINYTMPSGDDNFVTKNYQPVQTLLSPL